MGMQKKFYHEELLRDDDDYELWTIDYSNESWEQFEKDLNDPKSDLSKVLFNLGDEQ